MDIVITVPDTRKVQLLDGYAKRNGYQPQIKDAKKDDGSLMDNPQTKLQFLVNHTLANYKQITDNEIIQVTSAKAAESKRLELSKEKW